MNYKWGVKVNDIATESAERSSAPPVSAHTDMGDLLDFSAISEPRRHFYVYCILLLFTLFVHTYKEFNASGSSTSCPELTDEVARLIEIGAVGRNLY